MRTEINGIEKRKIEKKNQDDSSKASIKLMNFYLD